MQEYESDIKLGERYRDAQTGIEGVATGVFFFQHGCERVQIENVLKGEIKDYQFDAPRLVHVATGQQAESPRTGGPGTSPTGKRAGQIPRQVGRRWV